MQPFDDWDRRTRRYGIIDLKLAQWAAMFLALAKAFPQIMGINIWWFWGLMLLFGAKPFYIFWLKDQDE